MPRYIGYIFTGTANSTVVTPALNGGVTDSKYNSGVWSISDSSGEEYSLFTRRKQGNWLTTTRDEPGSVETDPFWNDVVFLFQPTSADTTFDDLSNSAHSITNNGSVTLDTTTPITGLKSASFNGSNHLIAADSADFDFSGDFTVDCYVYWNSITPKQQVLGRNSTNWPELFVTTSNSLAAYFGAGERVSSYTATTGNWTFISMDRSGTNNRLYVNGSQVLSYTASTNYDGSGNGFNIGKNWSAHNFHNGYITMVRLTKGVARYNGTHVVPTTAFPTS